MKLVFRMSARICAAMLLLITWAAQAQAGNIVGGSTLLTSSGELQLEAWLDQGSLTLTNIFTKTAGDGQTSVEFHTAVDDQGSTFTVIEVLGENGFSHQVVGGYNPQSWSSVGWYNLAADDVDRTAFLFNLTTTFMESEKLGADNGYGDGEYQTYNSPDYGPTFGGGNDLHVDSTLAAGWGYQWSYGNPGTYNDGLLLGKTWDGSYYSIGTIEVFSIAPAAVPEPSSIALAGIGGIGLIVGTIRRRREIAA